MEVVFFGKRKFTLTDGDLSNNVISWAQFKSTEFVTIQSPKDCEHGPTMDLPLYQSTDAARPGAISTRAQSSGLAYRHPNREAQCASRSVC